MPWNKDKEISMDYDKSFDFIIEEGQNTSINLRKVSWNGRPPKLDLRKWSYSDGTERAMKGIGLSDEGADELSAVLVEQGYGDTKRIYKAIKKRADFNKPEGEESSESVEDDNAEGEYYDAFRGIINA